MLFRPKIFEDSFYLPPVYQTCCYTYGNFAYLYQYCCLHTYENNNFDLNIKYKSFFLFRKIKQESSVINDIKDDIFNRSLKELKLLLMRIIFLH